MGHLAVCRVKVLIPALVAGDSIVHCPELWVPRDLKQAVSQEDKNPTQRRQYLPEETCHHLWGCSSHRETGRDWSQSDLTRGETLS